MSAASASPTRILVTRTDRLGDVILATPVLRRLRNAFPGAKIYFLVQKTWQPVLQYGEAIELLTYDPTENIRALAERLQTYAFQRVYVLRDEKKVSWAVRLAAIPERVGPLSSLRSFFTFNRGRLQKRSQCRLHESEYNLDLISPVNAAKSVVDLPEAWVQTAPGAALQARAFIEKNSLRENEFVVIHPGSSGSARYVKQADLHALARAFFAQGQAVCISGGPNEDTLLDEFKEAVPAVKILGKQNAIGLDGMAEVYRLAQAVVAHGTGPLHLAAAVGTPVLAIFPPIFVLSEKRWGPLAKHRSVWTPPEVNCPAIYQCIGEKCAYYDCMDRFSVSEAIKRLEKIV